jgi:hypothetical protein
MRNSGGRVGSGVRRVSSLDACQEGGTSRSSGEALVTGVERRGRVAGSRSDGQPVMGGI